MARWPDEIRDRDSRRSYVKEAHERSRKRPGIETIHFYVSIARIRPCHVAPCRTSHNPIDCKAFEGRIRHEDPSSHA